MERNRELQLAWEFVEHTDRSLFLTGKAGTGKTTFLKTVMERSAKCAVVVAPTGVAAVNAHGVTIHSFFQLPLSPFVPHAHIQRRFDFSREKRRIIQSLDMLIIDEISMVRSDLLDAVDAVLRRYRDGSRPFGGVQLLMIGDLQQLTPVVTPEDEQMLQPYYESPYFFSSHALQQTDYVTLELEHVYRQQDSSFLDILNHIRDGQPTDADLERLNQRVVPPSFHVPDGMIRLDTHNRQASLHNEAELSRLPSPPVTFLAEIDGTFPETSYPVSDQLVLKVGAQVMFVRNDPSGAHRYYNGRIGRVTQADNDGVSVLCPGDTEAIEVEPQVWENARYRLNETTKEIEADIQGTFRQYPLRLAWAITIHKSQGLTFDRAIIDASASFAPGQLYVALSRCRSLDGLALAAPVSRRAVINDDRVETYISRQETAAQESVRLLPVLKEEFYRHQLLDLFNFNPLLYQEEHLLRILTEYFHNSYAQLTLLHKGALSELRRQLTNVAYKWVAMITQMPVSQLHEEEFLSRVRRSAAYFVESLDSILQAPLEKTQAVRTGNKEAMKRLDLAFTDMRQTYQAKRFLLEEMATQGFSMSRYLRSRRRALLGATDGEKRKGRKERGTRKAKTPKPKKEDTKVVTWKFYQTGMSPADIAHERGLSVGTIMSHLGHFVATGDLSPEQLISPEKYQMILQVIEKVGLSSGRASIKALCPPEITYEDLSVVIASMERE